MQMTLEDKNLKQNKKFSLNVKIVVEKKRERERLILDLFSAAHASGVKIVIWLSVPSVILMGIRVGTVS